MKNIVITGGTKGIGKAIIELFASHDFNIITCARNHEDLKILKEQIEIAYSKIQIFTMRADLSDRDDIGNFIGFVKDNAESVDVLVNNTGTFIPGELSNEPEGNLEMLINTNLYSAYHLTRGLIGDMMNHKSGYIFNMCSVASFMAYPNGGSYSISKFALYGFTKVLREEMKEHHVRVSAILPGATFTASWDGTDLPEDRFMKASDVADAVWSAYNMSPNSVVEEIIIRPQLGDL